MILTYQQIRKLYPSLREKAINKIKLTEEENYIFCRYQHIEQLMLSIEQNINEIVNLRIQLEEKNYETIS